ncbi:IS30 family transposase [Candidatus Wolfebacteria bacterium]|nr:IS30 family transposase [Candidatus Wolfebacteria bacterium]
MKKAKKLSKAERSEIRILRDRGYSVREIARAMGRSPNTISAELRRNQVNGTYVPRKAHHKATVRASHRRYRWQKIEQYPRIRAYVVEKLEAHWNPREIGGRSEHETGLYVSKTAIYDWLRSNRGQSYCTHLYSRRYRVKKRMPAVPRVMIPNRVGIAERPASAMNRNRYGHFEADTVVSGKRGSGAVSVLVERKSRYISLGKLASLKPDEHVSVLGGMLQDKKALSVTFDNGVENRYHERLGVPTFFCDPYSSWQKGTVENVNKMIRRYLPKGTNLSHVSQETLNAIASIINNKPRAVLGFKSAYEVAKLNGVFKSKCPF